MTSHFRLSNFPLTTLAAFVENIFSLLEQCLFMCFAFLPLLLTLSPRFVQAWVAIVVSLLDTVWSGVFILLFIVLFKYDMLFCVTLVTFIGIICLAFSG